MSRPVTAAEWLQFGRTEQAAGPAENVVSTECPVCRVRFAMVAKYERDASGKPVWNLRCTRCGHHVNGELKT